MCDNLNQCSCNVGFAGANCEEIVQNGSSNSGTFSITTTFDNCTSYSLGVSVGAIIGVLLGLLVAAAAVIVVFVFIKFWFRKGKSTLPTVRSRTIPKSTGKATKTSTQSNENLLDASSQNVATVNIVRPSAPPKGGYNPQSQTNVPSKGDVPRPPANRAPPPMTRDPPPHPSRAVPTPTSKAIPTPPLRAVPHRPLPPTTKKGTYA